MIEGGNWLAHPLVALLIIAKWIAQLVLAVKDAMKAITGNKLASALMWLLVKLVELFRGKREA